MEKLSRDIQAHPRVSQKPQKISKGSGFQMEAQASCHGPRPRAGPGPPATCAAATVTGAGGLGKPRLGGLSVGDTEGRRTAVMQAGARRGHATRTKRKLRGAKAAALEAPCGGE